MPSNDPISEKANEWMKDRAVSAKPVEIGAKERARRMSASIQRLARRLDRSPDELAARIPDDTLRRTKYPALEIANDDGTRLFKHDIGIS